MAQGLHTRTLKEWEQPEFWKKIIALECDLQYKNMFKAYWWPQKGEEKLLLLRNLCWNLKDE